MPLFTDYSSCNPIQISVYEDKICIWNDGEMLEDLNSMDKLFAKHSSKPYNSKLANVFSVSGMIEAWGRGFEKIKEACAKYDGPLPKYNIMFLHRVLMSSYYLLLLQVVKHMAYPSPQIRYFLLLIVSYPWLKALLFVCFIQFSICRIVLFYLC